MRNRVTGLPRRSLQLQFGGESRWIQGGGGHVERVAGFPALILDEDMMLAWFKQAKLLQRLMTFEWIEWQKPSVTWVLSPAYFNMPKPKGLLLPHPCRCIYQGFVCRI